MTDNVPFPGSPDDMMQRIAELEAASLEMMRQLEEKALRITALEAERDEARRQVERRERENTELRKNLLGQTEMTAAAQRERDEAREGAHAWRCHGEARVATARLAALKEAEGPVREMAKSHRDPTRHFKEDVHNYVADELDRAADAIAALASAPGDGAIYAEESRRRDPEAYEAALAQLADDLTKAGESEYSDPSIASTPKKQFRHKKRGSVVEIDGDTAELQSAGGPIPEGTVLTVYRHVEDGKRWARPKTEFEDGRFEALASTPKTEGRVSDDYISPATTQDALLWWPLRRAQDGDEAVTDLLIILAYAGGLLTGIYIGWRFGIETPGAPKTEGRK
jgi:hypothetical protein